MKDVVAAENASSIGFLIATKRVAEDEHKVCFMYREEPMDPKDSGWRVFAGDESQAYVDNPDNSGIYPPATILAIDASIQDLLKEPVGSAFERADETSAWTVASDFAVSGTDALETIVIGGAWTITISGIFDFHEDEEGDSVFAADGRTARIAIWDFADKTHEEVIAVHREFMEDRDQSQFPTLESVDRSEPGICRIGIIVQESDNDKHYKVLYGYTIIGREVAQGAYYYDEESDREWAFSTWMSVRTLEVDF